MSNGNAGVDTAGVHGSIWRHHGASWLVDAEPTEPTERQLGAHHWRTGRDFSSESNVSNVNFVEDTQGYIGGLKAIELPSIFQLISAIKVDGFKKPRPVGHSFTSIDPKWNGPFYFRSNLIISIMNFVEDDDERPMVTWMMQLRWIEPWFRWKFPSDGLGGVVGARVTCVQPLGHEICVRFRSES